LQEKISSDWDVADDNRAMSLGSDGETGGLPRQVDAAG
jgi:hypothetical protein